MRDRHDRSPSTLLWVLPLAMPLALLGCKGGADSHVPEQGPPAVSGGGLEIVQGGAFAIATDPARASIHIVDLVSRSDRRIQLEPGDEPGRVVEDQAGRVHVVLRRAGDVLTIDPESGEQLQRRAVCVAPRGIAVDPDDGQLVVACAEGVLVRLPAGEGGVSSRTPLDSDLRDVVVYPGGRMLVTRFRSAELLVVEGGRIVRRDTLPEATDRLGRTRSATVAWRMRPTSEEGALIVHQHSVSSQLGTLGSMAGGQYYGGDCDLGVVRTAVSRVRVNWASEEDSTSFSGVAFAQVSLGVDVDTTNDGRLVVAGAAEPGFQSAGSFTGSDFSGPRELSMREMGGAATCATNWEPSDSAPGAATGVAALPGGGYAVYFRDPAQIQIVDDAVSDTIDLDGGDVTHIGHALFHEAAGTGATCAGCHPEGGEDGHVWAFETGARRSQTLLGGILSTLPFHWDGQVTSPSAVMQGTFVDRMGGVMPRPDEVNAFSTWMDELPAMPGAFAADTDAVERGRLLFEGAEVGCVSCHAGNQRTNNQTVDVGTQDELGTRRFQVPALYEVAYHAPYMHDGRAPTLDEVVSTHGGGATLEPAQQADMVAYLRSL